MKRVNLKHIPLKTVEFSRLPGYVHAGFYALWALSLGLMIARLFFPQIVGVQARWPDGVWIVTTAGVTLAGLARQLPGQNVMLAAVIVGCISTIAIILGVKTGIPFGPFTFEKNMGPPLFDPLPGAAPLIWIVAILNARGVARLALRPWRKTRNYGFWLLGVTALLAVLLDANLEPFATQARNYWTWSPTKMPLNWYSTPWSNFLGWTVTCAVILGFGTPALITKKPGKQPPDYHPLIVWVFTNLFFAVAAFHYRLWSALALSAVTVALSACLGLRRLRQ